MLHLKRGASGISGEFSIEQSTDDGAIVTGGDKDRDYDRDYDGKGTTIVTKMGGVGVDENGVSFGLSVRIVSLLIVVSIVVPIVVIPS